MPLRKYAFSSGGATLYNNPSDQTVIFPVPATVPRIILSLFLQVMNKKLSLQKQNSSSSSLSSQSAAGMKGPPPPYVQPPQPLRGLPAQQPSDVRARATAASSSGKGPAPQVPGPGVPTYANVQFRFKGKCCIKK